MTAAIPPWQFWKRSPTDCAPRSGLTGKPDPEPKVGSDATSKGLGASTLTSKGVPTLPTVPTPLTIPPSPATLGVIPVSGMGIAEIMVANAAAAKRMERKENIFV